jgi:colanic acid biosynthesis protein WcaH
MLPREQWLAVVRDAPLVSIDLIVRDADERVLLGLRLNQPARGTWFVPGGVIRKDERLADAFARISGDELGTRLSLAEARFFGVYEHHYPTNFAGAAGITTHYVVLPHTIQVHGLSAELPATQHQKYRWLSTSELLADADVHEYTKAYFRHEPI